MSVLTSHYWQDEIVNSSSYLLQLINNSLRELRDGDEVANANPERHHHPEYD